MSNLIQYLHSNAHFMVIHVPIAMLIFSFVFDLTALLFKRAHWHSAGLLCLFVGTLGAIAAVLTGPEGERNPLLPQHELFGKLTMAFFIVLTLIRLWLVWKKKYEAGRNAGYLAAAFIGVLLVSYTGHLGGSMVHHDGPGGRFGDYRGGQFRSFQGQGPNRYQSRQGNGANGQGQGAVGGGGNKGSGGNGSGNNGGAG